MNEDISAAFIIGASLLIIFYIFFGMAKTIIKDYRERKEEAAEKERKEMTVEMS